MDQRIVFHLECVAENVWFQEWCEGYALLQQLYEDIIEQEVEREGILELNDVLNNEVQGSDLVVLKSNVECGDVVYFIVNDMSHLVEDRSILV